MRDRHGATRGQCLKYRENGKLRGFQPPKESGKINTQRSLHTGGCAGEYRGQKQRLKRAVFHCLQHFAENLTYFDFVAHWRHMQLTNMAMRAER